jgi:Regulator of chromosome condensation (RCC1) repeat
LLILPRSADERIPNLSGVVAISAGQSKVCALLSDQTVSCWSVGAAPTSVAGLTEVGTLGVGGATTCATVPGGAVKCVGGDGSFPVLGNGTLNGISSTPVLVSNITGATLIGNGAEHTCAIVGGGSVWCWGRNTDGQLGSGSMDYPKIPVMVN